MENKDYIEQNGALWYTGYLSVGPQQGWQCPCCKTVYAPWVQSCECEKNVTSITYTWPTDTAIWVSNEEEYENLGTPV